MPDSIIEKDIKILVARIRGCSPYEIEGSDRLQNDLGMDGDDAAEFVASVQDRFGTDLTELYKNWSKHFGPEMSALLMPGGPAILTGLLIAGSLGLSPIWSIALVIGLSAITLWAWQRFGPPARVIPITVGDVVNAVKAGRWPKAS